MHAFSAVACLIERKPLLHENALSSRNALLQKLELWEIDAVFIQAHDYL